MITNEKMTSSGAGRFIRVGQKARGLFCGGPKIRDCPGPRRLAIKPVSGLGQKLREDIGMTGEDRTPDPKSPAKTKGEAPQSREARLGEALRANLRRRKAAAKTRQKD